MSVELVQLAKGKIIGTGDIHLVELVPVDKNEPSGYVKKWDISEGPDDKVTAYLTGTSGNYTLHIYGCGKMRNYTNSNQSPWTSYRVRHFVAHNGITAIGNYAMAGDTNGGNLSSITISSTVREIGVTAFCANNTSISSLNIGNGVRHIRNTAFAELAGLETVTVPSSVRRIDNNAFKNVPWYVNQTTSPVIVGDGVMLKMNSTTANRVIPSGVKFISGLGSNSYITSLTLPSDLYGLGRFAMDSMTNLTSLTLPDSLKWADTACLRKFGGTTINIPPYLSHIPSRMLLGSVNLTHIYIPASVSEIWTWEHGNNTAESGPFANGAPFFGCSPSLHIYCETSSKPAGWDNYWDYISSSARATVHWGVTRAEYQVATGGE